MSIEQHRPLRADAEHDRQLIKAIARLGNATG